MNVFITIPPGISSQWPVLCGDVHKQTLSGQITWLITVCRWAITGGYTGAVAALMPVILSQIQLFWEGGGWSNKGTAATSCRPALILIKTNTHSNCSVFCCFPCLEGPLPLGNYSGSKTQVYQGEGSACSYRWDWIVIVYTVTYKASVRIWIITVDKALQPADGLDV